MALSMSDDTAWAATSANEPRRRLAMIGFRKGNGGVGRVMTTLIDALLDDGIVIDLLLPSNKHPDLSLLRGEVNRFVIDLDQRKLAESTLRDYLLQRRPDAILSNRDQSHRLLQRRTRYPRRWPPRTLGTGR